MRTLRFDAERQRLERAVSRHEAAKNAYFDADAELLAAKVALSDAKADAGCCDRNDCERPRLPKGYKSGDPKGRTATIYMARRPEPGDPFDLFVGEGEHRGIRYVEKVLVEPRGMGTRPFTVRYRISPPR